MEFDEEEEINIEELVDHLIDNPDKFVVFLQNVFMELDNMQEFMEFNGYNKEDYMAWRTEIERRTLHWQTNMMTVPIG